MGKKSGDAPWAPKTPLTEALRLPKGPVDVQALDSHAKTGYPGKGKKDAPRAQQALGPILSDLQERLFAAGRVDDPNAGSLLVILQGMDTSGKGGVIRHAFGLVDPQGLHLHAFKRPTEKELSHHYLWRVRRQLPKPGMIGIFDRSHYEDVLVPRVNRSVRVADLDKRYDEINRFEQKAVDAGTTVIKCFLHVSFEEQRKRLLARLDDPEKYWKYNPGDVDERAKWPRYQKAYNIALERCNTDAAPWYVIPADRKWYRNWAVAQLLREHLEALDLTWPEADFDVDRERQRLAES